MKDPWVEAVEFWANVCARNLRRSRQANDRYASCSTPALGSEAELVAALERFRDAVEREPHRQLVRYLHS